jgi:hypothetical protein
MEARYNLDKLKRGDFVTFYNSCRDETVQGVVVLVHPSGSCSIRTEHGDCLSVNHIRLTQKPKDTPGFDWAKEPGLW